MELDYDKIDDAVLALLALGKHDDTWPGAVRAWKAFDWEAMDHLYEKGFISDPKSKTKSVVFTDEGLERAETLLESMFGRSIDTRPDAICEFRKDDPVKRKKWNDQLNDGE
jgi:hypothetical protein